MIDLAVAGIFARRLSEQQFSDRPTPAAPGWRHRVVLFASRRT